jgi:hypothetical protein
MATALELVDAVVATPDPSWPDLLSLVGSSAAGELDQAGRRLLTSALLALISDLGDEMLPGQIKHYLANARQQAQRGELSVAPNEDARNRPAPIRGRHTMTTEAGAA